MKDAYIFTNDEWYNSCVVHDKLEAWYWSAIFSGEYDSDQNERFESNLSMMLKSLHDESDGYKWIENLRNNVLNKQYFSERGFMLMEKRDEGRVPKAHLRRDICQFLLSKPYPDLIYDKEGKQTSNSVNENSEYAKYEEVMNNNNNNNTSYYQTNNVSNNYGEELRDELQSLRINNDLRIGIFIQNKSERCGMVGLHVMDDHVIESASCKAMVDILFEEFQRILLDSIDQYGCSAVQEI